MNELWKEVIELLSQLQTALLKIHPKTIIRRISANVGLTYSTVFNILHKYKLFPYHFTRVQGRITGVNFPLGFTKGAGINHDVESQKFCQQRTKVDNGNERTMAQTGKIQNAFK